MIDWKLAKKLKEAGFPQETMIEIGGGCDGQMDKVGFYFVSPPESCGADGLFSGIELEKFRKEKPNHTVIKLPTLEELIEAVRSIVLTTGEGMESCHRVHLFFELIGKQIEKSIGWTACAGENFMEPAGMDLKEAEGQSALEAVANLWLKLKEK